MTKRSHSSQINPATQRAEVVAGDVYRSSLTIVDSNRLADSVLFGCRAPRQALANYLSELPSYWRGRLAE